LNVIEAVLQFGLDEYDGTGSDVSMYGSMIGAKFYAGASANDEIHLVLTMRLLGIGSTLRQNVDASAHGRDAKKLEIQFALLASLAREIVDVEVARHRELRSRKDAAIRVSTEKAENDENRELADRSVKEDIRVLLHQRVSS